MNVSILDISRKDELIDCLSRAWQSGELDFVALLSSKWHAVGFSAWLRAVSKKEKPVSGIILVLSHPLSGFGLIPEDFSLDECPGNLTFIRFPAEANAAIKSGLKNQVKIFSLCLRLLSGKEQEGGRPFYLISSRAPIFSVLACMKYKEILKRRRLNFVEIDEGVGSYISSSVWVLAGRTIHDWKKPLAVIFAWLKSFLLEMVYYPLCYWCAGRKGIERWFLFNRTVKRSLVPNGTIVGEYRAVLDNMQIETRIRTGERPVAVLVTQNWREASGWSEKTEMEFLKRVTDSLTARGFKICLKPHPREIMGKYSALAASYEKSVFQVIVIDSLVEALFSQLSEKDIVVGMTSSSLLTAAALFGIHSYTLADSVADLKDISTFYREHCRVFKQLAEGLVPELPLEGALVTGSGVL